MGVGTAGGVTGVLTAALFSAKSWMGANQVPSEFYTHVEITPGGGTFSVWQKNEDGDEINSCQFWNASHFYSPRICDTFGISRISMSTGQRAIDRAIKCAAEYDTQCILSGEIGFSAPAAFLYDVEQGFRIILAPRFVTNEVSPASASSSHPQPNQKLVRIQDPSENTGNTLMKLNSSVDIEYVNPGSRSVIVETLTGNDAYCVQMMRASVSPACWMELD